MLTRILLEFNVGKYFNNLNKTSWFTGINYETLGSKCKKSLSLIKLNAVRINIIVLDINNSISSSRPPDNNMFINEALFELFDTSLCVNFNEIANRGNHNGKKRFPE